MSLKLKKDELELLSNKDIAELLLEDSKKPINTADLFKKIIKLLELPESSFESKIADFYTALATDKRFILLDNGKWDLRSNHTSDKVLKLKLDDKDDEDEEKDEDEEDEEDNSYDDIEEDNYDDTEEEEYDEETNEELKDLVVIDEDELELEV